MMIRQSRDAVDFRFGEEFKEEPLVLLDFREVKLKVIDFDSDFELLHGSLGGMGVLSQGVRSGWLPVGREYAVALTTYSTDDLKRFPRPDEALAPFRSGNMDLRAYVPLRPDGRLGIGRYPIIVEDCNQIFHWLVDCAQDLRDAMLRRDREWDFVCHEEQGRMGQQFHFLGGTRPAWKQCPTTKARWRRTIDAYLAGRTLHSAAMTTLANRI